ncbi:MAG: beta-N-acetylhexosaminidase [Gammaproteobacteria bacterium]|nr:beta-N-acetylhexosaminidase [Gammaproteobacteria bacterium]
MSLGPVMVDLQGYTISGDEREMLQHPLVGGVILFTRNYQSMDQLQSLIKDIHQIRTPRLLVAVDQEGGRVQRFREGFIRLPALSNLGKLYKQDKKYARSCAETCGWLMASEMLAIGIDISFAPVLDLDYGVSSVIGDRAFAKSAFVVSDLAHAYIIGMRKAGMAATGKHFPGHGAVHADSHTDLPIDERRFEDLQSDDMLPFERMIHFDIAAMMMAHVVYSRVDNKPASFSPVWIKEILRKQIGFQGAVFSDDLTMVAAHEVGGYKERAQQAMQAGCDMVIVCNSPDGQREVLDNLEELDNPVSHCRLIPLHGKFRYDLKTLQSTEQWKKAVECVKNIEPEPLLDMDIE